MFKEKKWLSLVNSRKKHYKIRRKGQREKARRCAVISRQNIAKLNTMISFIWKITICIFQLYTQYDSRPSGYVTRPGWPHSSQVGSGWVQNRVTLDICPACQDGRVSSHRRKKSKEKSENKNLYDSHSKINARISQKNPSNCREGSAKLLLQNKFRTETTYKFDSASMTSMDLQSAN